MQKPVTHHRMFDWLLREWKFFRILAMSPRLMLFFWESYTAWISVILQTWSTLLSFSRKFCWDLMHRNCHTKYRFSRTNLLVESVHLDFSFICPEWRCLFFLFFVFFLWRAGTYIFSGFKIRGPVLMLCLLIAPKFEMEFCSFLRHAALLEQTVYCL